MSAEWLSSILADFDGTACAVDVASAVCEEFSADGWQALDESVRRGELTLRQAIAGQCTMLQAPRAHILRYVLDRFQVDPGFVRLVDWAESRGVTVTVVSDGFGFYIAPMLAAAGLSRIPVLANKVVENADGLHLEHPFAHPQCSTCGTCKMLAVEQARAEKRGVAFVGDGESDRFGAFFADAVFAKARLAVLCSGNGVPYFPWNDFDDVRDTLATLPAAPAAAGRARPARCPGRAPARSNAEVAASPAATTNGTSPERGRMA